MEICGDELGQLPQEIGWPWLALRPWEELHQWRDGVRTGLIQPLRGLKVWLSESFKERCDSTWTTPTRPLWMSRGSEWMRIEL